MKTVRFAELVAKSGKPEIYLRLLEPKRDPVLQRAAREHRVLSVHHEVKGTAKDFGTVGELNDRHAQLLVFPKSLRRFHDRRVIGINYDLLDDASRAATSKRPARSRKTKSTRVQRAKKAKS